MVVFSFLLVARCYSAFANSITDCDESMNYWEPTHYLMYGSGFQTWEYSPTYALRSYLYVALHATIGFASQPIHSVLLSSGIFNEVNDPGEKIFAFYMIRLSECFQNA